MTTDLHPAVVSADVDPTSVLRARLRALRDEVLADIAKEMATIGTPVEERGEDLTPSQHPADVATDLADREQLLGDERALEEQLATIDDALSRVGHGTYGRCADCGTAIPAERLAVRPQAVRCVACQREAERDRGWDRRR